MMRRWAPLAWMMVASFGCSKPAGTPEKLAVEPKRISALAIPVEVAPVVIEDRAWDGLLDAVAQDPEAKTHDVRIESDSWVHGDRRRALRYLSGPSQAALASYYGSLLERRPELALPPGRAVRFGGPHKGRWRSHLVDTEATVRIERVDDADLVDEGPIQGVELDLAEGDGERLGKLSKANLGGRLAVIVGGEVRTEAVVQAPWPGERLHLAPSQREGSAAVLLASLRKDESGKDESRDE